MNTHDTLRAALYNHANMPLSGTVVDEEKSVCAMLRLMEQTGRSPMLEAAFADLIARLDEVNSRLNQSDEAGDQTIRQTLYPLLGVVSSTLASYLRLTQHGLHEKATEMLLIKNAWRIAAGCESALAGDIESIAVHLSQEESALFE